MKIELFDRDTGESLGFKDIPDDIITAARGVERWLRSNCPYAVLCGLKRE